MYILVPGTVYIYIPVPVPLSRYTRVYIPVQYILYILYREYTEYRAVVPRLLDIYMYSRVSLKQYTAMCILYSALLSILSETRLLWSVYLGLD